MSKTMTAAASFMNELMFISRDIVWKDQHQANKYETTDSIRDAAIYMSAKSGDINFTTIPSFSMATLEKAGVPEDIRLECEYDKWKIPKQYQDLCVNYEAQFILASYEEQNEYYRMLYGLPPIEDERNGEWIYITDKVGIDPNVPIHKLPLTDIYNLDNNGYIDELVKKYPKKKYLKFLSRRKIDPYVARSADIFSLLYMPSSDFVRIDNDFRDLYAVCRYAITRSVYVAEKRKDNEFYDNFIAMMILFMTINQMFARYLDADVNRDFYDYESIKYVYDHYGVPFYPDIPLEYHIKIIKNINILLRYKGSTEVFYKLFEIFNFGAMEVFDYYLVKTQKMNNGKPVFAYNDDGTENVRAMYDIKFGEVELYNNAPLELSDPDNMKAYSDLTAFDPYWVDDDEMLDKLYNMDYNYIESKYMGFSCIFDLMAITYESAVFFKLMFDNREKLESFLIYFSTLATNITMFDLIIYTCGLICKRYGYDIALNKPSLYIEGILGFNLKADIEEVKKSVLENPAICDDGELLTLLVNMNINNIHDIASVFKRIDSLRKLLTKRKAFAKTKEEFQAYSNLEKSLMTSKFMEDAFLDKCTLEYDASNPDTWYGFIELLADTNPILAERILEFGMSSDTSPMDIEIQTMLVLIRQTVTSLEYIELCCSGGIETMLEYLFRMLDFFKSAKAQLTGFQVSYKLGASGENAIKLFFDYNYGEIEIKTILKSFINRLMVDIHRIFLKMGHNTILTLEDFCQWDWSHVYLDEFLPLLFRFRILQTIVYETRINMNLHDEIRRAIHSQIMKDKLLFDDDCKLLLERLYCDVIEYYINDEFKELTDIVIKCTTTYHYIERSDLDLLDEIQFNLDRIMPEGIEATLNLEEILNKQSYNDVFDNLIMELKYSPIDLDKNFNWLISKLGESLMYLHDEVQSYDKLYIPIKNKIHFIMKYLIRAYHSWVRGDIYYKMKLRWVKSHTYLMQLFNVIFDLHKLTSTPELITYNIDYDLVMHHVMHKMQIDDSLDLKPELTLLYEYIERYFYEYVVNDQFEELTVKLLGSICEVEDIQKFFLGLKDILKDRSFYKDSAGIIYKLRMMDYDIEIKEDISLSQKLIYRSLSYEQIEEYVDYFTDFVMNHIKTTTEIKEIEKNYIVTVFKHIGALFVTRNSFDFTLKSEVYRIRTSADYQSSWKLLVDCEKAHTIIRDKIDSEFGLYGILYRMHEGIRIDDMLNLKADEEPSLVYERIYSEMLQYLLNDQFDMLAANIMNVTNECHDIDKFFMGYSANLNHDLASILGDDESKFKLYYQEIDRYYHYVTVAKKGFGFNFDFSNHDLLGNPGVLLSTLGESVSRLFAHIHLNSQEIATKLKSYFSLAISRITIAYTFLLEDDGMLLFDDLKHFDLGTLSEQILNLILKTNKLIDMPIGFEGMKMRFKDWVLPMTIDTFDDVLGDNYGHMEGGNFYTEFFEDYIGFVISDGFKDLCVKIIKSTTKYETLKQNNIMYDDEMCDIMIKLMNESAMPMFIDNVATYNEMNEEDRALLITNIEGAKLAFELGKYAISYYFELKKVNSNIAVLLRDKLDLFLAHIVSSIVNYKHNTSLTYADNVNLINLESKMSSGFELLIAYVKNALVEFETVKNELLFEILIKVIENEVNIPDTQLYFDEMMNNELAYSLLSFALNGDYGSLTDAIHDYTDHYLHDFNIKYKTLIKLINTESDFDVVQLFNDYMEPIRNNYRVLKMFINGDYGMITDEIEHIYISIKEDKLTTAILSDKLMENESDKVFESVQNFHLEHFLTRLKQTNEIETVMPMFLEFNTLETILGLNEITMLLFFEFEKSHNEIASLMKSKVQYLNKQIMHVYTSWAKAKLLMRPNVELVISDIYDKDFTKLTAGLIGLYYNIREGATLQYADIVELCRINSVAESTMPLFLNYETGKVNVETLISIINGEANTLLDKLISDSKILEYNERQEMKLCVAMPHMYTSFGFEDKINELTLEFVKGEMNIEEATQILFDFGYSVTNLDKTFPRLISYLEYATNLLFIKFNSHKSEIKEIYSRLLILMDYISGIKKMALAVKMGYGFDVNFISSMADYHYMIKYLFKINAISMILEPGNHDLRLTDVVKVLNENVEVDDFLVFSTRMDLLKEQIFCEVIEYLLNDQFEEFADKMIKCIYINRYINKSYLAITDWLGYDSNNASFTLNTKYLDKVTRVNTVEGQYSADLLWDSARFHMVTPDMIRNTIMNEDNLFRMNSVHEKTRNSFGFETKLIVEYEQIVEN